MTTATITLKGKVKNMLECDGAIAYQYIQIPTLTRKHCNMHEFRTHPRFGSYANSDLFEGMLNRSKKGIFGHDTRLRLDQVPQNVTVDTSGFLATVIVKLP